ncbi:MAG: SanA/YdcF family protein [Puniceicoccales bacterium]
MTTSLPPTRTSRVRKRLRLLGWTLAILVTFPLSALVLIVYAKREVEAAAEGRVATQSGDVPATRVGLVLGCSRTFEDGRENPFFANRMSAASELYRAGKVEYLLVSGDNSRPDYDESSDMRAALMELGVPAGRIVRDYAGFSTLDSILRARDVFGLDRFVVVSQDFHVRRALYIARGNGMDATGYVAGEVSGAGGRWVRFRESLARVKVLLDVHVFERRAKFTGEPISIGSDHT